MKFTLSWLKEHLETNAALDEIVQALNDIGFEVEGVEDSAKTLKAFVVGAVISAERHPNADRLRVCMVDTGAGTPVQVVCGAPNARAGMRTAFAAPGTFIPGSGITLKLSAIRGVESQGMLCSARELNLGVDGDGILDLSTDLAAGTPLAEALGRQDAVVEISVTPNRGDVLGIRGIARELAAKGLGQLKALAKPDVQPSWACPISLVREDCAAELCPQFALRVVRGVKNGPSPRWLAERLEAIGLRSINTLVDITNYLSFDQNRPLHVFDADKLKGGLVVRSAKSGEALHALDGKTYALTPDMCVIADDSGVVSLAGIMGGEATGCSEDTQSVVIESALWNPLNIAQTGRKLGIHSDARHRFERGVDPAFAVEGLEHATRLVLDLCGGEASAVCVVGEPAKAHQPISMPLSEIKRLTGLEVSAQKASDILSALGFAVSSQGEALNATAPSWRYDIEGKADLVEEVVRLIGLNAVPTTPLPKSSYISATVLTKAQKRNITVRRALAGRGLMEAMTWSFISNKKASLFGQAPDALKLANPIAEDLCDMRPSLIPGLLGALQANVDRGFANEALFELGQIFAGTKPNEQIMAAAVVRHGAAKPHQKGEHWRQRAALVDVFDAKADALAVLAASGFPIEKIEVRQGGAAFLHPGRSGTLALGPQILGVFGELHPKTHAALDLQGAYCVAEVYLSKIPETKSRGTQKAPLSLSPLQPLSRDFSFLIAKNVRAVDVVRAILAANKTLIEDVAVFDVYEGKGVPEGHVSLAVRAIIQPQEKTLNDQELEALSHAIVASVHKATGGTLRG